MSYINDTKPTGSYTSDSEVSARLTWALAHRTWANSHYQWQSSGVNFSNDTEPSNQTLIPEHTTNQSTNLNTPVSLGYIGASSGTTRGLSSFFTAVESTITKVVLGAYGVNGTPTGDIKVEIVYFSSPNWISVGSATHTLAEWDTAIGGEIEFVFSSPLSLTVGNQYWVRVYSTQTETGTNNYTLDRTFTGLKTNGSCDIYYTTNNWTTQSFLFNRPTSFFRDVQVTPAYYTNNYTNDSEPS